ncbi:hypothetical protein [Lentzea sp. NPDC055074]
MKSTCSTVLRRTLGVAGFLIGFGLLSAGVASADDDSPGLLGGVAGLVSPVTDAVAPVTRTVSPVVRDVTAVADPVLEPALKAARPVTAPLLAPLAPTVDSVVRVAGPVLEPLRPVTAPLLTPVVATVQDVPLVTRVAEPLVAQPSAPADVPPAPPVAQAPDAQWTPAVVPESRAVVPTDRAAVAVLPQRQHISAPDLAPPIEAPQQPLPDVPFALPGTTGSVSSNGSAGTAVSDLPTGSGVHAHGGSPAVSSEPQVHGSWCYYYGRNHPS